MKKVSFLICFYIFPFVSAFSQTQAEIEKMMKETKDEIEKFKKDPKNKEQAKDLPNMDSIIKYVKENSQTTAKIKTSDTSSFSNKKLLHSLPIRIFNKAELISYLHNLNSKLTELLRSRYGKDITNIPGAAVTKTGTSIGFWINGEPEISVLVALKGAEMNPDNTTLLNNAGGILVACGLSVNAIPVLQYVLEKQPGNNMVLNNLGQAYLDLDDDKKAEQYLLQCIKSYNYYPDANLGLAYISERAGNKAAAIKYAENSLRGAWSAKANNLLLKLKPGAKLMDLVRHRYKQPEHFNIHKYPLLSQCMDVEETSILKSQYDGYQKMLWDLKEKYFRLEQEESKIADKTVQEIVLKANKAKRSPFRPFGNFAVAVLADLNREYSDKFIQFEKYKTHYKEEIRKLEERYTADIKKIDDKWATEIKKIGEGYGGAGVDEAICKEKNKLGNSYLLLFSDLTTPFRQEALHLYKDYLNDWSYWSYIASVDDHAYKAVFYNLVQMMIGAFQDINTTKFIFPCLYEKIESKKADSLLIEEPECYLGPAKVVLPLGVLKLEISCESYKLEAGQGWIGKLEYDRTKGEVTLAFGLGGSVPALSFKKFGAGLEGEAEVKSQFYITFDKNGPSDLGVLWEYEMKLAAGIGEYKVEVGLEEEALTAGFGSGVKMKEGGALKELIDRTWYVQPDANQINKNVPLYKK